MALEFRWAQMHVLRTYINDLNRMWYDIQQWFGWSTPNRMQSTWILNKWISQNHIIFVFYLSVTAKFHLCVCVSFIEGNTHNELTQRLKTKSSFQITRLMWLTIVAQILLKKDKEGERERKVSNQCINSYIVEIECMCWVRAKSILINIRSIFSMHS